MTTMYWTAEHDAILLRMRSERVPYAAIGQELDRTTKSLAARMRVLRNGAPGRKQVLTLPHVNEFATAAAKAGVSSAEIAAGIQAKFGLQVHVDTVRVFARKFRPSPIVSAPETVEIRPVRTEVEFAEWVIRKKEWPVQRLDMNGMPAGFVKIALSGGMVPA